MPKTSWQVIHLSTGHAGGAGLAARRLNEALNESGITSKFMALAHRDYRPAENEFEIYRSLLRRVASGFTLRLQTRLSNKVLFSLFSLSALPKKLITSHSPPENTILHFHNWFNLVSQSDILKWSNRGYKVIVTMHDQRLMTGGCHYAFNCQGLYGNCSSCPELAPIIKNIPSVNLKRFHNRAKQNSPTMVSIAPSRWLLEEGKKSFALRDQQITFIPNTLSSSTPDLNLDLPTMNLRTPNTITLGIASMARGSFIKGGDITDSLEKAISVSQLPIKISYMTSFPQSHEGVSSFWKGIDYLLVLSRAENSPNVIHEAKSAGIPVIATKVGGITELLDSEFDIGIDLEDLNTQNILKIAQNLIGRKPERRIQEKTQVNFHRYVDRSVGDHIALYKEVIGRS